MANSSKNWLVRTRSRQVLGPFSQQELYEHLRQNTFTPEDEIAPHGKDWISAQTLLNHDFDEVTSTSAQLNTRTLKLARIPEDLTPSSSGPTPTPSATFTPVEIIESKKLPSASEAAHQKWQRDTSLAKPPD